MRLTPLEIRKQSFSRKRLGGVDQEEVQDFINLVASEMEALIREHALVKDRLDASNQKITEFQSMEETLRRTLVRAEEMSSQSHDHARRESDLILQEAQLRAERILGDARNRLRQLSDEVAELRKKKDVFLGRFRSLIEMQLELLNQHLPDYDDVDRLMEEAKDVVERHAHPVEIPGDPSIIEATPVRAEGETNNGGRRVERHVPPSAEGLLELGTDDDT